jgi:hypothetical protein
MAQPPFEAATGLDLPSFEAAIGAYRLLKRRFMTISTNVESDYLFS